MGQSRLTRRDGDVQARNDYEKTSLLECQCIDCIIGAGFLSAKPRWRCAC